MTTSLYIFAGGGTGGHLYPGIAVAQALRGLQPDADILFLCTDREIDARILSAQDWPFEAQPVRPIPHSPGQVIPFIKGWFGSLRLARQHIRNNNVAAVLGLGGYAAAPAMETAAKSRIPVAMLNPDAVPGVANKFCRHYAGRIFVQWEVTRDYFGRANEKCQVTGCPIRGDFARQQTESHALFNLNPERKVLLIMGGSQGGRNVNEAFIAALINNEELRKELQTDWQTVHLAGKIDYGNILRRYQNAGIQTLVLDYTEKMPQLLTAADLVIARAGASSLAEITACGLPSILLPYPYHKDQHQLKNARVLADVGAAHIVTDYKDVVLTASALAETLQRCMRPSVMTEMAVTAEQLARPDAAAVIAQQLINSR